MTQEVLVEKRSHVELRKKINHFEKKNHCDLKIGEWLLEIIVLVKKTTNFNLEKTQTLLSGIFQRNNWDYKLISRQIYPCWLAA
jgi:hypothetical protein